MHSFEKSICEKGHANMLWSIIVLLVILWLLGFSLQIGGGLVHIHLVVALVVLIFCLVTEGRFP